MDVSKTDDYICITLKLSIIDSITDAFKEDIMAECEQVKKHVLIDMKNVSLLSSRAISTLVNLYKVQRQKNKRIALLNLKEETEALLRSINLTHIIQFYGTVEEFLLSLDDTDCTPANELSTQVHIESQENLSIIHLERDARDIDFSQTDFNKIFSSLEHRFVMINCAKVINLDEETISSFVSYAQELKKMDGRLLFVGMNEITKDLFTILGINQHFEFVEDIETGLEMLTSNT